MVRTLKYRGKQILSFLLCSIVLVSIFIVSPVSSDVNATVNYKDMATAMLSYFHGDKDADIKNLESTMSPEEYRVFGVFLSNFYSPLNTYISNSNNNFDTGDNSVLKLFGKAMNKNIDGDTRTAKKLVSKVREDILGSSVRLKYRTGDSVNTASVNTLLDFRSGNASDYTRAYSFFYESSGKEIPVFKTGDEVCEAALSLAIQAGTSNMEQVWQYITNKLKGTDLKGGNGDYGKALDELKGCGLFVTPFGDIVASSGENLSNGSAIILVPACLNPYTFRSDGTVLHLNNAFCLSNFITLDDYSSINTDTDGVPVEDSNWQLNDGANKGYANNAKYSRFYFDYLYEQGGNDGHKWSLYNFLGTKKTPSMLLGRFKVGGTQGKDVPTGQSELLVQVSGWSTYLTRIDGDNRKSSNQETVGSSISLSVIDPKFYKKVVDKKLDNKTQENFANGASQGYCIPLVKDNPSNVNDTSLLQHIPDYTSSVKEFSSMLKKSLKVDNALVNICTASHNETQDNTDLANNTCIYQIPAKYVNTSVALFETENTGGNNLSDFTADSYTAVVVPDLLTDNGYNEGMLPGWLDLARKNELDMDAEGWGFNTDTMRKLYGYFYKYQNNSLKDLTNGFSDSIGNFVGGQDSHNRTLFVMEALVSIDSKFTGLLKGQSKLTNGGVSIAQGVNLWAGVYWAYADELIGLKIDSDGKITYDSTLASKNWLPEIKDNTFKGGLASLLDATGTTDADSSEDEAKRKQTQIIDWIYAILDPNTNLGGFAMNWLKSMVDNLILSAHNAMIGADLTNLATTDSGQNVYHGVMGYITTPSVSQLPVISWIFDNYLFFYIAVMVVVLVVLIVLTMIHLRKIGQSIAIFLLMGFIFLLPHTILNGSILVSNNVAESIFSDRFSYWAIAQHEETIVEEATAKTAESATLMDNLNRASGSQIGSGVTVKWLSPKKQRFWNKQQFKEVEDESGSGNTISMLGFYWLFENQFQGEEYDIDDADSTYLYRSYYSIYTEAKRGLSGVTTQAKKDKKSDKKKYPTKASQVSAYIKTKWGSLTDNFVGLDGKGFDTLAITGGKVGKKTYPAGYYSGYLNSGSEHRNQYANYDRIVQPLTDETLNKVIFKFDFKNARINFGGITDKTIPTNKSGDKVIRGLEIDSGSSEAGSKFPEDHAKQNMFLLYTESPYYYFYNTFSSVKVGNSTGATDFVSALLSEDFFTVTDSNSKAYGKTKDFLDLEGLFTFIIPYLNRANENVEAYTDANGLSVSRADCADEATYNYKLDNLQSMWNIYTPWVDALYDMGYTDQNAKSGYDTVQITDALNPASYYKQGRPMSFSPADAKIKGYVDSDLTAVEDKLNKVLEKTRKDLLYLLNYKDFESSDKAYGSEVLISAAAMIATFNFNQEFSDTSLIGSGITLYPQSYELKNMNYDSYLRLILQNATGKTPTLNTEGNGSSIYSEIISETSFITGVCLLINDILAVYAIPAVKIIMLVVLVLLGFALALFCLVSPPEKLISTVCRNYIIPILIFTALLCIHTYVVSLFVGDGASGVIGAKNLVLVTDDPTVTLIILILTDLAFVVSMYLLVKWSCKKTWGYVKNTVGTLKAIGVTAGHMAVAGVAGLVGGASALAHGAGRVASAPFRAGQSAYNAIRGQKVRVSDKGGNTGSGSGQSGGSGSSHKRHKKASGKTYNTSNRTASANRGATQPNKSVGSSTPTRKRRQPVKVGQTTQMGKNKSFTYKGNKTHKVVKGSDVLKTKKRKK